ncbi:hypothetical protein MICAG_2750040 [Microcystis aeruginosa PCC 9808]|uniref:Uncharacterized protein n=1 Tax=Microcystis aeruginosa PCC 9808 TaxID=1160284 RepID=I4HTF9_MICAE|nr:hypothetical protein MICAG_2750040 [Microcystis aeruginosa PCC 9808]
MTGIKRTCAARYWLQIKETPNKYNAFCCRAVGRVILAKR